MTTSIETSYKNILQIQAFLWDLNYNAGSKNAKKGTKMRNTLMENNQCQLVMDQMEKRKERRQNLNIIKWKHPSVAGTLGGGSQAYPHVVITREFSHTDAWVPTPQHPLKVKPGRQTFYMLPKWLWRAAEGQKHWCEWAPAVYLFSLRTVIFNPGNTLELLGELQKRVTIQTLPWEYSDFIANILDVPHLIVTCSQGWEYSVEHSVKLLIY